MTEPERRRTATGVALAAETGDTSAVKIVSLHASTEPTPRDRSKSPVRPDVDNVAHHRNRPGNGPSINAQTGNMLDYLLCPRPRSGSGGIRRSSASFVRLMSRTWALTRKPNGLRRRNFAQGYPRSHATPTPTSRSKGQKSRSRGGGILWRPPSRTAC